MSFKLDDALEADDVEELKKIYGIELDKSQSGSLSMSFLFLPKSFYKGKLDIHKILDNGNTLLHYAISLGATKCSKYLIDIGSDLSIKNKDGLIPLQVAVVCGNVDLLNYLIEKRHINNLDDEINIQLAFSLSEANYIESKPEMLVPVLAEMGVDFDVLNKRGFPLLHDIIIKGNPVTLGILLDYVKNPNIIYLGGRTALDIVHIELDTMVGTSNENKNVVNDLREKERVLKAKGVKNGSMSTKDYKYTSFVFYGES